MKRFLFLLLTAVLCLSLLCACGGGSTPASENTPADGGQKPPSPEKDQGTEGTTDTLAVGDRFVMGAYEQDGNTANGKEPIAWTVLAIEEGRMLLVSEKVLDAKAYHTERTPATWENATLRTWLRDVFTPAAFSAEDAAKLLSVTLSNPDNGKHGTDGGKDTTDKVFLLSADEVEKYLTTQALRLAKPTAYAKVNDVWTQDTGDAYSWLRSPGGTSEHAMILHGGGAALFGEYADSATVGVRPAIWVTYTK